MPELKMTVEALVKEHGLNATIVALAAICDEFADETKKNDLLNTTIGLMRINRELTVVAHLADELGV